MGRLRFEEAPRDVRELLDAAALGPLLPAPDRERGPVLARRDVEALLPHRDPFLFIDRITRVDEEARSIVCRHELARSARIVAGHFPGRPLWPGVLQVEAVGQAGLCLLALLGREAGPEPDAPPPVLTDILEARFLGPVLPDGELEIVTRVRTDGLFTVLVGQCLQWDRVCSVAAVRGIHTEERP